MLQDFKTNYTDIDRDGHEISRFGGLSYIFPRDDIFPKCAALREILSRGKI